MEEHMTKRMEVSPVVRVLMEARERLAADDGWVQGNYEMALDLDTRRAYCMAGAVGWHDAQRALMHRAMAGEDVRADPRYLAVLALTNALVRRGLTSPGGVMAYDAWINPASHLINFNDSPRRTKEEVLAVFDDAIAEQLGVAIVAEVAA
jgi:hypothetical protein